MEVSSMSHDGVQTSMFEGTTVGELESQRMNLDSSNPRGTSNALQNGVDVSAAQRDFVELSRHISELSRSLSGKETNRFGGSIEKELEAGGGGGGDSDTFDLETHLRGVENEERRAGIKSKRIGVLWEDLTVSGIGGVKNYIATFPDAFVSFFNVFGTAASILGLNRKGREIDILKNFRGVARPGEMVLVLGRPGSGCTTFLKVMANQRFGYTKVDGKDDIHHPTLTVRQTLGFALDTKTPAKRLPGMSKTEFKESVINLLLKMFDIEHTRNTIVRNPFVRGVSGGERKRVSIAEMMITRASVCCWDNSTRGLDASTALDYAKSLRIMTNIHRTTTFVSLYQVSENIYEQFDKVLVIDSGRQVFYGPIHEARAYFERLGFVPKPRQTTPDYLTGCTDEFEREYAVGRDVSIVPSSPEALEQAFRNSPLFISLNQEIEQYREEISRENEAYENFVMAIKDDKRSGAGKKSVYTIPYYQQIWALMQRQFLLKWQDKFLLTVSWGTSITIAIVTGTLYLHLPQTSAGAFTRGGLLFIALLFNAFQAFAELASTMLGRPIVNKHKAFTFHRPSALWIAQILVDLLFAATQILVFCLIVYFMTDLARSAGAFLTFYLIILSGYIAMTLFFRTVGCLCPDFDYAMKFASVILTRFVVTSGYLIPAQHQGDWLSWIFWINSLGSGFASLMMNEFRRVILKCTSESLVPSGPRYSDINHQTCCWNYSRIT